MSDQLEHSARTRAPEDSGEFALPDSRGRGVTVSEYDALADLFLAGSGTMAPPVAEGRPPTSGATRQPSDGALPRASRRVEAIVVGHLPVLAAVWVGQYARRLAETLATPVALLRLHAGQCALEITGDLTPQIQSDLLSFAATNPTLEHAIERAARHAGAWLIRTDEPDELSLADRPEVTDVTLLTGADDVALVATYRTLKALATGASGFGEAVVNGSDAPQLRIAILGATPERANSAEAKLARTASTFLGRPVTILNAGQRIGSSPLLALHRCNAAVPAAAVLAMLDRALPATAPHAPAACSTAFASSDSGVPSGIAGSRIGPARFEPRAATVEPKIATPRPAVARARGPATPKDLPSLFPGMRPLPTRCPYAPGVQFGLDAKGRLHLFAMPESDLPPHEIGSDGADWGPARTLAQLVAASGWAFDHVDLLRLASPGFAITGEPSDTTLHLLTGEPKSVRRLLDSGVLVHAVVSATVGDATTWVVRDLN